MSENEKDVDRCIRFIQQQIEEKKMNYAQHTEEFSTALLIGLEAGIKQANGEFSINRENTYPQKGKGIMKKITKYFSSSIVLTILIIGLAACNGPTRTVNDLPREFVKCESSLTGDKFKYAEKVKYPDAFCVNQKCINIYEITDLSGNRIILNEHELRDEWNCTVINKENNN